MTNNYNLYSQFRFSGIIIFLCILSSNIALSQDVIFNSQEQINAFDPETALINGDLSIAVEQLVIIKENCPKNK